MLTQKVIKLRQRLIIHRFLRFLAITIVIAVSLVATDSYPAKAEGDGVTWSIKLDPNSKRQVLITVRTTNLQNKLYLAKVRCKVYFFDQNNEQIGEKVYAFTSTSPRSLPAKRIFHKKFPISFAAATLVKGDDMFYEIWREGSKADDPSEPPPFVKNGKVKADPK